MKKIATATIATAGIATFAFAHHDAQAAEQNNDGYNPNDPYSYSYTYTIDAEGNYHYHIPIFDLIVFVISLNHD